MSIAVIVAVAVHSTPASSQSDTQWDSLYDRIIRLEHRLNSVEQDGGTSQATEDYGSDPAANASLSLRIDQVEGELRQLLGQVQELNHRLGELTEQLRRSSEDAEYRFQQLESDQRGDAGPASSLDNTQVADLQDGLGLTNYGDLSVFEHYPTTGDSSGPTDLNSADGTQVLGTLPLSQLEPNSDALASVNDSVDSQPLGDGNAGSGAADALYQQAYSDLLRRDFTEAESGFERFLSDHASHELAPNAQYWLGETHYARGDFREAAAAFLSGYRDYASSNKAPDSLVKLGMSLRNLGEKDQACASFERVPEQYPNAPQSILDIATREHGRAGC